MHVHSMAVDTEELITSADCQATKTIIFSQFLGALSLLEEPLRHDNIGYLRLDGSMSLYERAQAVRDFARMPQANSLAGSIHAQASSGHRYLHSSVPRCTNACGLGGKEAFIWILLLVP